ncbi:hypothetical protein [uncultured Tenacibaculum sp.]|uniref:hypothetical protein n=1 Tax=uncultured Tenacibaculum sp. TaxID=174713 RepID=UPI0026181ECE|nr:hypothetical protein [uncultured Tenacibaculum sp.]
MNKLSFNSSWLFLVIPIGIVIFVVIPQFQGTYKIFQKQELEYQQKVAQLDSLRLIENPPTKVKNQIKRLEISVPISEKSIERQRYTYYKTGGMLLVLAFMFTGMFGSSYLAKLKKKSPSNKVIEFNFEDPSNDVIGREISWNALENSGSNFLSERLRKTVSGYKITSSGYMKVVSWSFFLMGLNYTAWSFIEHYKFKEESLGIMEGGKIFFTSGGIFMLIGFFFLLSKGTKVFFHKHKRKMVVGGKILPFKDAYALQVLEKFIEGNSSGSYFCYEVNLVTKDGDRYNLLNHGDKEYLLSDMVKISKALNIPVWNRGVV